MISFYLVYDLEPSVYIYHILSWIHNNLQRTKLAYFFLGTQKCEKSSQVFSELAYFVVVKFPDRYK